MLRIFRNRRGQSTAEYAILIGLIVAAAVAMQTYVKRGLQGRVKDAVDTMATSTGDLGGTTQYEPYYLESNFDNTRGSTETENVQEGGGVIRDVARGHSERTGTQTIKATEAQ